jgi:molecular chaperone GrpE
MSKQKSKEKITIIEEKTTQEKSKEETLQEELNNQKEQYLRLQAEYANFVRRTREEQLKTYDKGASDVLAGVVKVLDDFELALANAKELEGFKKGMEMIYANIISTGEEFGLERIKTQGEEFNAIEHEALLTEESKEKEQTILQELQSGYKVKGKVIRTAKVKVAK